MKYLTTANAKTPKGEAIGYLTGILYLAPSDTSGVANVCTHASVGCKLACLNTAGRAQILPMILEARKRKTRELFADRQNFMQELGKDIASIERKAKRLGLIPCIRVNGTSDLPWLAHAMALQFPEVQFYDYTKHPKPWTRTLPNYHLTFSYSEVNLEDSLDALRHGVNVAVVFGIAKSKPLPEAWQGFPVVNGDETDLRFLDAKGCVIGLHAKGRAKQDCTGFVVRDASAKLVQIG